MLGILLPKLNIYLTRRMKNKTAEKEFLEQFTMDKFEEGLNNLKTRN